MTTATVIVICVLVAPIIAMFVLGEIGDRLTAHADPQKVAELRRRLSTVTDTPLPPPHDNHNHHQHQHQRADKKADWNGDNRTDPPPRWIEH
ncbi:hypothetical protein QM806_27705 [Rhodococcus sp. IEGM 1351]|uniref:hypothetical protein n=1 Tax=Rhodococcus sp. IEGM 1351 TaxID=3047089 RepID=UPI0022F2B134|nr:MULTISPECIES: hypothetical protein [Rhodococcus]MDI9939177.1 hypothetical protein [Rhodococcus sp. IEGM 1351]GLK33717.1 hypothetical protein GCM10017611_05590 [Rhodococcus wratislaviensis]